MFTSSNPCLTIPPLSLLPHSQQLSHFSFILLPITIYPASRLTFLSSPAWMAGFSSLWTLSLFFPLWLSIALPPSYFHTCFSPSHFHYHSLYSTIHLFFTYCGPMANFIYVLMIKRSLKHLVCEDLMSLILSVFPQESFIYIKIFGKIKFAWFIINEQEIFQCILSVTEPAVSCLSQLFRILAPSKSLFSSSSIWK